MTKLTHARIASVLLVLAALTLLSSAAQLSSAQKKGDPPVTGGTTAPTGSSPRPGAATANSDVNQSFYQMELLLTGKSVGTELDQNRRRRAAELSMDIRRLEQLNQEQIAPMARASSLDYRKLSRAASEIKNRAIRIKYDVTLSLKKKGEKIHYESRSTKLEALLPELSGVIKSFIDNPVFHERERNDEELRAAAGHDLEGIIKLSGEVNKLAKRLAKARPPSA
jgi:hypothetical protein